MSSWPTREADLKMAAALKLEFAAEKVAAHPFITVSREYGCDSRGFAVKLVEKLNALDKKHPWHIFDRDDLLQAADPEKLDAETLKIFNEYGHSEFMGYLQEAIFGQKDQHEVIRNMAKIMRMLARRGHIIFVGQGATVLTAGESQGVHVRLFAPQDWRVDSHAKRWNLDRETARTRVIENQSKREAYLKIYLAHPIEDPNHYDLMINNSRIDADTAAQMTVDLIQKRFN